MDGGRSAAAGFEYQYLCTLETMLREVNNPEISVCRVEGDPDAQVGESADSVDYDLLDTRGVSVLAVQVKGTRTGRSMGGPEALRVIIRLIRAGVSSKYLLQTNAVPSRSAVALSALFGTQGKNVQLMRTALNDIFVSTKESLGTVKDLTDHELIQLSRVRLEFDARAPDAIRDSIYHELSRLRQKLLAAAPNMSGLLTGFLLGEVLRRAADRNFAMWSMAEFRTTVMSSNHELMDKVHRLAIRQIWGTLPRLPDVQRKIELARLKNGLNKKGESHLPGAVKQAFITGLSGLGKTSLAVNYVATYGHLYDHIFWLDASSAAQIEASFQDVMDNFPGINLLSNSENQRSFKDFLAELQGSWFVVLDDLFDSSILDHLFPLHADGTILATTINSNRRDGRAYYQDLGVLLRTESRALIQARLGSRRNPKNKTIFDALARAFDDWPLAIEVSTSYIRTCRIPIPEIPHYLTVIKQRSLSDPLSVPPGYPRTLVAAILQSLERSRESADQETRVTIDIAFACAAFLSTRQLPLHLLLASSLSEGEPITALDGSRLPVLTPETSHPHPLEVARILASTSLVKRDQELSTQIFSETQFPSSNVTLAINSIVQEVLRYSIGDSELRRNLLNETAFHTERWLTFFFERHDISGVSSLLPHAIEIARHSRADHLMTIPVALLYGNLAGVFTARNQGERAREYLREELRILKSEEVEDLRLEAYTHLHLATNLIVGAPRDDTVNAEAISHIESVISIVRTWRGRADRRDDGSEFLAQISIVLEQWPRPFSGDERLSDLTSQVARLEQAFPASPISQAMEQVYSGEKALQAGDTARALLLCMPFVENTVDVRLRLEASRLVAEAYVRQEDWSNANIRMDIFLEMVGTEPVHRRVVELFIVNLGLHCSLMIVKSDEQRALQLLRKLITSQAFRDAANGASTQLSFRIRVLEFIAGALSDSDLQTGNSGAIRRQTMLSMMRGQSWDPADIAWEELAELAKLQSTGELPRPLTSEYQLPADPVPLETARSMPRFLRRQLNKYKALRKLSESAVRNTIKNIYVDCLALLASDPMLSMGSLASGNLGMFMIIPTNEANGGQRELPVILMEFRRAIIGVDGDGRPKELQVESIIKAGFGRMLYPSAQISSLDKWSLRYDGHRVLLLDGDGGPWAAGTLSPTAEWLLAARDFGAVLVAYGPRLGVRIPSDISEEIYGTEERRSEWRDSRSKGIVAGSIIKWVDQ